MRKFLGLFLLFVFAINSYSAPLIFKTTKEIDSPTQYTELGTFDVTKYKKIRITVENNDERTSTRQDYREFKFIAVGVEDKEVFINQGIGNISYTTLVEEPPSQIRIKIAGRGKFTLYVWGSQ